MSDNQLVPGSGPYNQQQRRARSAEKNDERPEHFFEPDPRLTNTPSPNQSFWEGTEHKLGNTLSPFGSSRSVLSGIFPEYDCCSFDSSTPYNNYRAESSMSISSFPDPSSSSLEANTQTSIEPNQASSMRSRSALSSRRSSQDSGPCPHQLSKSRMIYGNMESLYGDKRPHFMTPSRRSSDSSSSSSNVTDGNLSGDNSEI